jgi:hypothetical protein
VIANATAWAAAGAKPTGVARRLTEYVPGATPLSAVIVAAAAVPLIVAESKVAVMPVGRGSALSVTAPLKFVRDTVSAAIVALPANTFAVFGLTDRPIVAGVTLSA